jgi:S1-C subfamily serine protease
LGLERNGPAAQGGLRDGDIVLKLDDRPMSTVDDIHRFLNEWPIGQPLKVSAVRGTQLVTLSVAPGEAPG